MIRRIRYHPFFIKLFHWEYWPFHLVYFPVYIYWMWLSLKARSFFFFSTANPSIRYAGFMMESKKEIYDLLPSGTYPETVFFLAGTSPETLISVIEQKGIRFPMIGKPDTGLKGLSVKKLYSKKELLEYARLSKVDFLIQEFVSYKNEVGIFYYRYPHEAKGQISGIVKKEFLAVTGNGRSTIKELLLRNQRHILQLPVLEKNPDLDLSRIPLHEEECVLVPYGNHIRGAKFTDASDQADESLNELIDKLAKQIDGFYFGRMDIRYQSWEELKKGNHFSVIEVNGAGSEPTHIYDPGHSLFFAWKEIIRHLNILWKISKQNHHPVKRPFMSFANGIHMLRQNKKHMKQLNSDIIL